MIRYHEKQFLFHENWSTLLSVLERALNIKPFWTVTAKQIEVNRSCLRSQLNFNLSDPHKPSTRPLQNTKRTFLYLLSPSRVWENSSNPRLRVAGSNKTKGKLIELLELMSKLDNCKLKIYESTIRYRNSNIRLKCFATASCLTWLHCLVPLICYINCLRALLQDNRRQLYRFRKTLIRWCLFWLTMRNATVISCADQKINAWSRPR